MAGLLRRITHGAVIGPAVHHMSPNISIRLLAAQPDGRLADLAGRGNERAFEALVGRYRAPLLRYCARLGLNEALAEDVVQHSLLKAWLALTGGTTVRELRPWLYRIVHNLAISSIRVIREQPGELPDTADRGALGSTSAGAEDRLAAREALGHVAALPQMQRHAIVLTAIEGRSHEEAASVLGITDGAVRGLVHRARETMRSAAAALMPPGLQGWLSRGSESLPLADRSGEITAGAGVLGLTGALAKGALVAATAGLVIAGGSAVRGTHHGSPHRQAQPVAGIADAQAPTGATSVASSPSSSTAGSSSAGTGRRARRGSAERHRSGSDARGRQAPLLGASGQSDRTEQAGAGTQHSGERPFSSHRDGSGGGSGDGGHHSSGSTGGGQDSGGDTAGTLASNSGDSGSGSGDSEPSGGVEGGGDGSAPKSGDGSSGGDSGGETTQPGSGGDGSGSSQGGSTAGSEPS